MASLWDQIIAAKALYFPKANIIPGDVAKITTGTPSYELYPSLNPSLQTQSSSTPQITPQAATTEQLPGGGGGGTPQQPSVPSIEDRLRSEISSGWDSYINSLNQQLGGLDAQRSAQENIARSQYQQGVGQLDLQKQQGLQALGSQRTQAKKNQGKTLKDISSNLKNAFQAGNIYLGTRGAGDSSAANQYSYALTKMGTRQRSDVMSQTAGILDQINARETNLNNIYNAELNNLSAQRDQAINQVAQWYSNAQNQLRQMQSQGQLGKSQDLANVSRTLLNQALSALNSVQNSYAQNTQSLQNWASQQAEQVQNVKADLQAQADFNPNLPFAQNIAGTPTVDTSGNYVLPTGYSSPGTLEDIYKNSLFGSPTYFNT